jgi:hypothetical protein
MTLVSQRSLRDSLLADLRTARDSLEQLRKLQHETNLAFLESCRRLGIKVPPTLLNDTGYSPPTTAVRRLTEAVNKRSINADDTKGNDEDPGEGEEEEDSEVERNGEDIGYEGTSEGEDEDSSDFNTSSIGASSTSPRPSTSPDTSPPHPISAVLASVWGNGFA